MKSAYIENSVAQKIWIVFCVIIFVLFFLFFYIWDKKAEKKWNGVELSGIITDMAVKKNDKHTFIKIDSLWYPFLYDRKFEEKCYLGFYLIKHKNESNIWLKETVESKDSIGFVNSTGNPIIKSSKIYWIEKERLNWNN